MAETFLIPVLVVIALVAIVYILQRDKSKPYKEFRAPTKSDLLQPATVAASPQTRDMSMLPEQFIVLDLETTGLSPDRNEIIEVGAIRVHRDSDHHEVFQTLVKPKKKVPRRITEMTGISQSMVDGEGDQLEVALADFIDFIQDLPLVSFNADFDMRFLRHAAKRHGLVIKNRYTCALQLSRRAWPGLSSYRLAELAKMGNLPGDDAHRALGDCERAMVIFVAAASEVGKNIRWSVPPS